MYPPSHPTYLQPFANGPFCVVDQKHQYLTPVGGILVENPNAENGCADDGELTPLAYGSFTEIIPLDY